MVFRVRLTPQERANLVDIIRARSFRSGTFTLASGATSTRYFNLKPTMMDPQGGEFAARALLAIAHDANAEYVTGLEMGAVPVIGAMAAVSSMAGTPLKTCFVRKATKAHGTQQLVEGLGPDETLEGKRVLVIDDVATSGGSILKAVEAVRAAGAIVEDAACLLDRGEGAEEALSAAGIRLHRVVSADEIDPPAA